jgi:hypothetical protein
VEVIVRRLSLLVPIVIVSVVALSGCYDQSRYLPTSPDFQDALTLAVAPPTIPSNGFATTTITASVSPATAPTKRTIVFKTTAGTFVGSGSPETDTIESLVNDTSGSTSVQLRSSRTVQTATVTATVKGVNGLAKEVQIAFAPSASSDVIRLSAASSAPADGQSMTALTADIAAGLPSTRRRVTFTTTLGSFVASDDPQQDGGLKRDTAVDATGDRAVVYLRSPSDRVGEAIVTASVDSSPAVSATTSVRFVRAYPERVLLTIDKPTVLASFDSSVRVTVTLVRDFGVPTEGTVVTFLATDAAGTIRGSFTNVSRSSKTGVVLADFSPGPMAALGPLTITATVDGTTTSGQVRVEVVM